MSYRDIATHIAEMYDLDVSNATISAVTDKLIPELKAWQQRTLDSHYLFVWLDAIHYKLTKTKGAFPNENSLLKLLYVDIQTLQKKGRCQFVTGV